MNFRPLLHLGILCWFGQAALWGQLEPRITQVLSSPEISKTTVAQVLDVDGDGDLDVVFPAVGFRSQDSPGGIWLENLGSRNFAPPRLNHWLKDSPSYPESVAGLGDYTGAAAQELLVVESAPSPTPPYGLVRQPVAITFAPAGGGVTRRVLVPEGINRDEWFGVDLDGDGPGELLVFDDQNSPSLSLGIWRRQPAGSYAAAGPPLITNGPTPTQVTAVDLDRDGDLDLVRSEDAAIRIHERLGPQSFASASQTATIGTEAGRWGDLTGDGLPEWFVLTGKTLKWLPNLGGLKFGTLQSHDLFPAEGYESTLLRHAPGSGTGALLSIGFMDSASSFVRTVRFGTWEIVSELPCAAAADQGVPTNRFFQAMADFDGDGHQDVLVRVFDWPRNGGLMESFTRLLIAWGGPAGLATPAFISPPPSHTRTLEIGDYDRDGDPDLIVGPDLAGGCYLLTNDGRGGFAPARALTEVNSPPGAPADVRLVNLAQADLDHDGIIDLALTYRRLAAPVLAKYTTVVANGRGDGSFIPPAVTAASFEQSPGSVDCSQFIDWDGDGDLDAVGATSWWENTGGHFNAEWHPLVAGGTATDVFGNPVTMAQGYAGDLDGDGFPDFVQGTFRWIANDDFGGTTTLAVAFNDGHGGLSSLNELPVQLGGSDIFGNPVVFGRVAIADVNADGLPDLCTLEVSGTDAFGNPMLQAYWRRNPGGSSRTPSSWLKLSLGLGLIRSNGTAGLGNLPFPDMPAPMLDFDGDGVREWVAPAGYLRPSPKGPAVAVGYDLDGLTELTTLPYRGAADFDGDGDADFLIGEPTSGLLFLLRNPLVDERSRIVRTLLAAGATGKVAGPDADADGDGWANLTELAGGSDPLAAGSRPGGRFAVRMAAAGGGPAVTFQRRTDAAAIGFEYRLEVSTELAAWTPVPLTNATVRALDATWEEVRVPTGPPTVRRFYRLAASAVVE